MDQQNLEELKYPVGRYTPPSIFDEAWFAACKATISDFPIQIENKIANITESQLNTPYRPGGWTVRQVVHHCADSHMNAFIRFKLALTEENPTIKPYIENLWAEAPDYQIDPQISLGILKGLHHRWSIVIASMSSEDFNKSYIHPEHGKVFSLAFVLGMYDWHCRHHLAHIVNALKSNNL